MSEGSFSRFCFCLKTKLDVGFKTCWVCACVSFLREPPVASCEMGWSPERVEMGGEGVWAGGEVKGEASLCDSQVKPSHPNTETSTGHNLCSICLNFYHTGEFGPSSVSLRAEFVTQTTFNCWRDSWFWFSESNFLFSSVSSPTCSQNVNLRRCHSRLQLSNIFQGVPPSFAVEDVYQAKDLEVDLSQYGSYFEKRTMPCASQEAGLNQMKETFP